MTRIAFLGTPEAAVPTLEALAAEHEVVVVVTRPDRPVGRSKSPAPSPVKVAALALGLEVAQPESGEELAETLESAGPLDVAVVVAYGRILRPEVLGIPVHGFLNVHFSLLPRWRGAAPVNRALIAGDTMTGVTLIRIDEGLDTGPVLTAQAIDIEPDEDAGSLTHRLARLGASLLAGSLQSYLDGDMVSVTQSDEGATYAAKLEKGDRALDTSMGPAEFVNRVRGMAPSPGASIDIDGAPHKILAAAVSEVDVAPGTWSVVDGWPVIGVDGGSVKIGRLQASGRKPVEGDAWVRGRHTKSGSVG